MIPFVLRRNPDRKLPPCGLLVALILTLFGTSLVALERPAQIWDHKDWHASYEQGRCAIWTGGDGAGTYEIAFDMGGMNASARYLPIVYSNLPLPLQPEDEFVLIIDHHMSQFGSEMSVYDGRDSYDRQMVAAGMTAGFVPDLVVALRQSESVAVQVMRDGEAPFIADDFSLSGFGASYLKISEWCQFDPNALFRS
ncbi:MAG: hypothetical protein ACKVKF_09550 [Rhodobacterales bacterium]|uniref:hypothetical protein n=1 Tax=Puniceibacterium antarcticum TaxID=1206336 RepID=UPI0011799890|nr:hypothetical protein [Puniceibacterium antarcticum]